MKVKKALKSNPVVFITTGGSAHPGHAQIENHQSPRPRLCCGVAVRAWCARGAEERRRRAFHGGGGG